MNSNFATQKQTSEEENPLKITSQETESAKQKGTLIKTPDSETDWARYGLILFIIVILAVSGYLIWTKYFDNKQINKLNLDKNT